MPKLKSNMISKLDDYTNESSSDSGDSIIFAEEENSVSIKSNVPMRELNRYFNDFEEGRVLGTGGFGSVYRAKHKLDGNDYAVKKIFLSLNSNSEQELILREAKIFSSLNHPCIGRYFNSWIEPLYIDDASVGNDILSLCDENGETSSDSRNGIEDVSLGSIGRISPFEVETHTNSDLRMSPYIGAQLESIPSCTHSLYIQMQLGGENLRNWLDIRNDRHCKISTFWTHERTLLHANIFRDITSGLAYLHSNKIMHRDIKPANIVFHNNSNHVFITDFGLARQTDTLKSFSATFSSTNTHSIGTPIYSAPETKTNVYNTKVDIYSLGIILMELICPFQTTTERANVLLKLRKNIIDKVFAKKWDIVVKLIQRMINSDPDKRPDANTLHQLVLNTFHFNQQIGNRDAPRILLKSISLNSSEYRKSKKAAHLNGSKIKRNNSLSFSRRSKKNTSQTLNPDFKKAKTGFLEEIAEAEKEFRKLMAKNIQLEANERVMKAEILQLKETIANLRKD